MNALRTEERRDENGVWIEVLAGTRRIAEVRKEKTIYTSGPNRGKREWDAAKVNWGAWGSRTPEVALEFARGLAFAAELAARLDAEFGGAA